MKFDFSSNDKDGDNALNTLDTMDKGYQVRTYLYC